VLAALVPGPRVLDLGIGPGTAVVAMARADASRRHVGLDVSGSMLRRARRRARRAGVALPLLRGDALALPVRSGALDGATAHSLLYLLPDPGAALREIRRVLRPGGAIAVLEPRAGAPDSRRALATGTHHAMAMAMWRGMSGLHRRFDEAALADLLRAAGLEGARAWPVLSGYGVMATAARPVDAGGAGP
jgi:ubiquinone/menaquinone biosynthesis C-methylase UbiE